MHPRINFSPAGWRWRWARGAWLGRWARGAWRGRWARGAWRGRWARGARWLWRWARGAWRWRWARGARARRWARGARRVGSSVGAKRVHAMRVPDVHLVPSAGRRRRREADWRQRRVRRRGLLRLPSWRRDCRRKRNGARRRGVGPAPSGLHGSIGAAGRTPLVHAAPVAARAVLLLGSIMPNLARSRLMKIRLQRLARRVGDRRGGFVAVTRQV